ncbi:MAG: sugar transferase [Patescibacteria group bacterium]
MRIKKFILLLGDIIILYASLAIALTIRYREFDLGTFQNHILPFSIVYFVWLIVFFIHNLYDLDTAKNNIEFSSSLIRGIIIGGLISIAFFYLIPGFAINELTPKTNLLLTIIIFVFLFYGWRLFFNFLIGALKIRINLAIVGYNPQAIELAKEIIKNPQLGYRLKLIVKSDDEPIKDRLDGVKIIQGIKNLKGILEQENISTAIIAPEVYKYPELIQNLFECIRHKIDFVNLSEFYETVTRKIPLTVINQIWFLENISQRDRNVYELAKRYFDFISAFILLICSLPFWIVIAIMVKFSSNGSVFYSQKRVGRGGKTFKLTKFRSMVMDAEKYGPKMAKKNDKRVTKFGRFMRKTRMDELPQLWNVIKGQMSFVGPRAERPEFHQELKEKIPFYQERYLIRPGLSGWAQIKHGYSSTVEDNFEKVQYDLYYIKNRSFILDTSIVLKTINIILRGGGR